MSKKALIIDDIPANIELLQAYLDLYHIETLSALTGQEGFAIAQSYLPNIIFVDLLMPEQTWNGYQTITKLKIHPITMHIPIVAVSGAGDENLAYSAGCNKFIVRPFQTNSLKKVLDETLLLANS